MVVFGGTSAVSEQLREIYRDHGDRLTPTIVVTVASAPSHPLHSHFEWDDAIAGHKHRLAQARNLIRSSKIMFKDRAGNTRMVNEYQSVVVRDASRPKRSALGPEHSRIYVATKTVVKDSVTREALSRQFKLEWAAFRRRWENFDEFIEMFGTK